MVGGGWWVLGVGCWVCGCVGVWVWGCGGGGGFDVDLDNTMCLLPRSELHLTEWPDTWDDSGRQRHWDSTPEWTECEKCRKCGEILRHAALSGRLD